MNTLDDELKPMSKTEAAQYIETVAGTIIGDYAVTARLYSKKTRQEVASANGLENDYWARAWAGTWVNAQKKVLGDDYTKLYGTEGFELRIWD